MDGLMMQFPLTVPQILDHGYSVYPGREIISILPDKTRHQYTYADLYTRSKKLMHSLVKKLGVQKGDFIGTFAWNHYQHVELYFAIPGSGAVCHTINIRLSVAQTEFIINNAEDRYIFIDATLVSLIEPIAALLPTVQAWIILNAPEGFTTTLPNPIDYESLIADAPDNMSWVPVEETEACGMCYTSGTTGLPKGVLYSHRSTYLHALVAALPNNGNISFNDRILVGVPQFHVMAWGIPFAAILGGAILVQPSCHLQPLPIIDIICKERVNKANGVPTIWMGIYAELKKKPLATAFPLEEIMVGGAAMPPSLIENYHRDFGIRIVHAWGMTETSPIATVSKLQPQHHLLPNGERIDVLAKQGQQVPCIEIRNVLEDGSLAPRDGITTGEIQVRGVWVVASYFKSTSRESFSDDGWLRTGDVGTIDAEGYLRLTDRAKDLIKSGGEWISSVALEVAIMGYPKVKEASVIAMPDVLWTERPLAVIVLKDPDDSFTIEELRAYLSPSFAKYQLPDQLVFVAEIPKTSVGKFNKKEMRRMNAEGTLR